MSFILWTLVWFGMVIAGFHMYFKHGEKMEQLLGFKVKAWMLITKGLAIWILYIGLYLIFID